MWPVAPVYPPDIPACNRRPAHGARLSVLPDPDTGQGDRPLRADGTPRATPLHFLLTETELVWLSYETAVHSQNIARDARVSLTLFSPDESRGPKGVYVNGQVELLRDDSEETAREIIGRRLGGFPPAFAAAKAYRLPIGVYNAEKSTGNCWYFYS